ncbi:DUF2798 domain-containing protein [Allorhizobium sp. BGMRC 0089]|uniref:DUF2798 domain-containing protein n=1 Tax=Allorhizobium sonneratiae TaxID=2934936 RepID=UPI002033B91C|nr:DUF2798 domain-containing protein [Allorhizobium sonneratiae]MCM2291881.1 DUF2798 domain-containing protein [Allorhizobium sonneratiae]
MTESPEQSSRAQRRYKLHHKSSPVVSAFLTAFLMAWIMCAAIASVNGGITEDLALRIWRSWQTAMPMAFLAVFMVRPIVARLTALLVHPPA